MKPGELERLQELEAQLVNVAMHSPDAALQWPLGREDFTHKQYGWYWEVLRDRARRGDPTDAVTAGFWMDEQNKGQGHMAELGRIMRDCYASVHIGEHAARIIRERALERRTVQLAQDFADQKISQLELVTGLKALSASGEVPAYTAAHGLRELVDMLETPPVAIPTGINRLDDKFSGLHKGDLVVLQARPGIGKTAISLTLARNMIHRNRKVLFYSGEMPKGQILGRLVAIEAGVPAYKFRSGKLDDGEWARFAQAASSIQDLPLFVSDSSKPTLDEVVHLATRMHEAKGIEIIMIDYAQRISTRKMEAFRHEQMAIAKALKSLARELDICVLLLAQSGRQVDQKEMRSYGQMPGLNDIQESAAYEQEADMVLGLARNGEEAALAVLKNRHGPVGLVPLKFDGPTMEFYDGQKGAKPKPLSVRE